MSHSAVFISSLPKFSPWSRPMNARGISSNPSTTCSLYFSLPERIQDVSLARPSGNL